MTKRTTNPMLSEREKQNTPLQGETSPDEALRKASTFGAREKQGWRQPPRKAGKPQ